MSLENKPSDINNQGHVEEIHIESLDPLISKKRAKRSRSPIDPELSLEEQGEILQNEALRKEVDQERKLNQGKSDAEIENEADEWLKNAGIDPDNVA